MRVLLIKPGAIGDLLQLSPVVRALGRLLPGCRIYIMVGDLASVDLFRHHPLVEEVLVYDRRREHRSPGALLRLMGEVRRRRFDLVVNFQRSNLKAWLLTLASLPCRILVYHKAGNRQVHAVVNHLEAVAPLGIDPRSADQRLELFLDAAAEQWADDLLAREGIGTRPLVALNLGASHPVNRWPVSHFAELAERLSAGGVGVALIGGAADRQSADLFLTRTHAPVLDMVGRTSLLQLGALLKRSAVAVSGDTGPMHMATAVGTPVVALFGAADPARTGPVGEGHRVLQATDVACLPCRSRQCKHTPYLECMERLSVDDVLAAAGSWLR